MIVNNEITTGQCPNCERPSIRIIVHPPLVHKGDLIVEREEEDRYLVGHLVNERSNSYWLTVEGSDGYITHYEAKGGVCWKCWDGAIWPDFRKLVVNIPPEMKWNKEHPWWSPTWESIGRECEEG